MRSHGKGSLSATTQVKVLSPEIILVALGQRFHDLETNIRTHATGESVTDVPGSKSVAGKRTVYVGTWENRIVPTESRQGAEDVTRAGAPVTKMLELGGTWLRPVPFALARCFGCVLFLTGSVHRTLPIQRIFRNAWAKKVWCHL